MKALWNYKIPIFVVFLCLLTAPCLAHDPIAIIPIGGTVGIGESGLDISQIVPIPGTSIGWWVSPDASGAPAFLTTVKDPLNFFVDPSIFVAYTGIWYVVTEENTADKSSFFYIQDPLIGLSIEDANTGTIISDGEIVQGDEIGFVINNNFFSDPGTPISIIVRSPDGKYYTTLVNEAGIKTQLNGIAVNANPFHTGAIWDPLNKAYAPGVYTVRAEITVNGMNDNYNVIGKTISATHTVTIPGTLPQKPVAPKASFTTDKTKGPAPLTVRFIDASKGTAPLNYVWDFNNDGVTDSTDQNPSYMYSVPGKYIVSLSVTNTVGSDTITKKITVT